MTPRDLPPETEALPPASPTGEISAARPARARTATTRAKARRNKPRDSAADTKTPLFRNDFEKNLIKEFNAKWVIRALLEEPDTIFSPVIFAGFCAWVLAPGEEAFRLNAMRLQLSRLMRVRESKLFKKAVENDRQPSQTLRDDSKYAALISDLYIPLGGIGKITAAGRRITLRNDFKKKTRHFEFCIRFMQILHTYAVADSLGPHRKNTLSGAFAYLKSKGISEQQEKMLVARQASISRKREGKGKNRAGGSQQIAKAPKTKLSERSIEKSWYQMSTTSALWYAATFIKAAKPPPKKRKKKATEEHGEEKPQFPHKTLADQLSCGELTYRMARPKITNWLQIAAAIDERIIKKLHLDYWKKRPVALPEETRTARLPPSPISDASEIEGIKRAFAEAAKKAK